MGVLDRVKSKVKELSDKSGPALDSAKSKAKELSDKSGPALDSAKSKAKELSDKSGPALDSAKSKSAHGLESASKYVDEKTKGKYSDQIHTGVGKAKNLLGQDKPDAERGEGGQPPEASAPEPEAESKGETGSEDGPGKA